MIAFQKKDYFGPGLEALIQRCLDIPSEKKLSSYPEYASVKKEIEQLVKKRFGLTITFIGDGRTASCYPNLFFPHHALISMQYQNNKVSGAKLLAGMGKHQSIGEVDLKNAKVSGWLSEVDSKLEVNFQRLSTEDKLTVPEIAAIFIHELGHIFTAAEYATRINRTNQIVADIARTVINDDKDKVQVIYTNLKSLGFENSQKLADDLGSGSELMMGKAAFSLAVGTIKSLTSEFYDETSYEALSDAFAARMGYAFHSSTSLAWYYELDNIEKREKSYSRELTATFILARVVSVVALITMFVAPFMVAVISAVTAMYCGQTAAQLLTSQRRDKAPMTYDDDKYRIARLKHQLIEQLKTQRFTVREKRVLLEQISVIQSMVDQTQYVSSSVETIANLLFRSSWRASNGIETQRELEKLMSNDIFAAAARLSLKA